MGQSGQGSVGRENGQELTAKTCPGSSVEWQISPSDVLQINLILLKWIPALRSEDIGVVAVQLFPAMHGIRAPPYRSPLFDEDRCTSICTSSAGKDSIV